MISGARKTLQAVEHGTLKLEFCDLFTGEVLDFYPETAKLFQVTFRQGAPYIQLGKYVGLIPINDRLAIDVGTRVPITNLERVVSLAEGYEPLTLGEFNRSYEKADNLPASLVNSISAHFLAIVERIVHEGLWLEYKPERHVGSFPIGRIDPFESYWRSRKCGLPRGVSTAFTRSASNDANNWILSALRKLEVATRSATKPSAKLISRIVACRRIFEPYAIAGFGAFDFRRLEMTIESIPEGRMLYLSALRIALLILAEAGIALRDQDGKTTLGSIFVDMEKVFEIYVREVLKRRLAANANIVILDGNKGGTTGAKKGLFTTVPTGRKNPEVTPDIVVRRSGVCTMVIDAKYKPLPDLPDRSDLNQLAMYASSYNCKRAALLYPDRKKDQESLIQLGVLGDFELMVARFDLSASNLDDEEKHFSEAIAKLL